MWVWLNSVGPILFDATLSTAIFLSLVVLAMLLCRQPSRRLLIARVSVIASLAMIPLVAFVPLPRLDLVNTLVESDLLPKFVIVELEEIEHALPVAHSANAAATHRAAGFLPYNLDDRLMSASRWLPHALIVIDIVCVTAGVAWLLLGFWGVRWLIRHSRLPSAATSAAFAEIFDRDRRRVMPPRLRISARLLHPVVVGLLRPTILLPPSFDEPSTNSELLRLSLLHEIAHAERRDTWFGAFASLAQSIWFFLPQAWWIRSQLLIDQEFLADQFAAHHYGTSSGYASSLVSLAQSPPLISPDVRDAEPDARIRGERKDAASDHATCASVTPAPAAHSALAQRVLMLLYCPFRFESRAPRSWSWMLRITLVMATFVTASLCIRWPDAAALEHRLKHGKAHTSPPFCVDDFTARPLDFSDGGRPLAYVMPVALPSDFDLKVKIRATMADLAKMRIVGYRLAAAEKPNGLASDPGTPSGSEILWHLVRLKRAGEDVSLWIDGHPVPTSADSTSTTRWLTFEPASDRPTDFSGLEVVW